MMNWRVKKQSFRNSLIFWMFVLPALILFGVFTFYPMFYNLYYAVFESNVLTGQKYFVGLENYVRVFTDRIYRRVLLNTASFAGAMLFIRLPLSLLIALIMNAKIRGQSIYRAIIFTPSLTSTAAIAILWIWIFDPGFGLLNSLLALIGINGPGWLSSTSWALPAIILMSIWKGVGYDAVIYLAGLQSIPQSLYEAARIDGASPLQIFRYITFPLLSSITFFLTITVVINSFQIFDAVAVMTQGGPLHSTNVYVYYLYQQAFQYFDMGCASAMAVNLLALILGLTIMQLRLSERWVHY